MKSVSHRIITFILICIMLFNIPVRAEPKSDIDSSIAVAQKMITENIKLKDSADLSKNDFYEMMLYTTFLRYVVRVEGHINSEKDKNYVANYEQGVIDNYSNIKEICTNKKAEFVSSTTFKKDSNSSISAKNLSTELAKEFLGRCDTILNDLKNIDSSGGSNGYQEYLKKNSIRLGTYNSIGIDILRIFDEAKGLNVSILSDSDEKDFQTKFDDFSTKIYDIAEKANVMLHSEYDIDSKLDKVDADSFDKAVDNEGTIAPFLLTMIANTSTFSPFISNVYKEENYMYLDDSVRNLHQKWGTYRKMVYKPSSSTPLRDAINGDTVSSLYPITLNEFITNYDKEERALYIKKGSYASQQTVEKKSDTDANKEEKPKEETKKEETCEFIKTPVYASGNIKNFRIIKKNNNYIDDTEAFMRKATTNYLMMCNCLETVGSRTYDIMKDLNKYLYIDIYGNIVTESGFVIVPAISNYINYGADKLMIPANAMLRHCYPDMENKLHMLIQATKSDKNKKYMICQPDHKAYFTANVSSDLTFSNLSDRKWRVCEPFVDKIDLDGKHIEFYDTKNLPVLTNVFKLFKIDLFSSKTSMRVVLFEPLSLLNNNIAINTKTLDSSTKVRKSVLNLNKAYLCSNSDGTLQAKSTVLNNKICIEIAKEVRNGGHTNPAQLAMLEPPMSAKDLLSNKGFAGIKTATCAGEGEAFHVANLLSPTWNMLIYTPKINQLPLMDKILIYTVFLVKIILILTIVWIIVVFACGKIKLKEAILKVTGSLLAITVMFLAFPVGTNWVFNGITKKVLYKNLSYLSLEQQEQDSKNIKQIHFDTFVKKDIVLPSQRICLGYITKQQAKALAKHFNSTELDDSFIKQFLVGDGNVDNTSITEGGINLKNNQLSVDTRTLFNSSSIIDESMDLEIFGRIMQQTNLKQAWTHKLELAYYLPYYCMIDNMLFNMNQVANTTGYAPMRIAYDDKYKVNGFVQNYFRSYFVTKGVKFKDEDIGSDDNLKRKVSTTLSMLGDEDDFLGILKISGLPFIPIRPPFNSNDSTFNNITKSVWYNNSILISARDEYNARCKRANLVLNGAYLRLNNPVISEGSGLYLNVNALPPNCGITVRYDSKTKEFGISTKKVDVYGKLGNNTVNVNGEDKTIATPVKVIKNNAVVPLALLRDTLGIKYYHDSVNNVLIINMPDESYCGKLGSVFEKVYKINNKTKEYILSMDSILDTVADEHLIKTIALYANIEYNKQFSTLNTKLYPKELEVDRTNIDAFLKCAFVPKEDIVNNKAYSLFYYVATNSSIFGVILLKLLEKLMFIKGIIQGYYLAILQIIAPLLMVLNYVVYRRYRSKILIGLSMVVVGASVLNALFIVGFNIATYLSNSTTMSFSNNLLWGLALVTILSIINIVGLVALSVMICKDIYNLGGNLVHDTFNNIRNDLQGTKLDNFADKLGKVTTDNVLSKMERVNSPENDNILDSYNDSSDTDTNRDVANNLGTVLGGTALGGTVMNGANVGGNTVGGNTVKVNSETSQNDNIPDGSFKVEDINTDDVNPPKRRIPNVMRNTLDNVSTLTGDLIKSKPTEASSYSVKIPNDKVGKRMQELLNDGDIIDNNYIYRGNPDELEKAYTGAVAESILGKSLTDDDLNMLDDNNDLLNFKYEPIQEFTSLGDDLDVNDDVYRFRLDVGNNINKHNLLGLFKSIASEVQKETNSNVSYNLGDNCLYINGTSKEELVSYLDNYKKLVNKNLCESMVASRIQGTSKLMTTYLDGDKLKSEIIEEDNLKSIADEKHMDYKLVGEYIPKSYTDGNTKLEDNVIDGASQTILYVKEV